MTRAINQELRSARRALQPGVNTQQAVAEAVCDLIAAETGRRPPIDADYVSKLERGEIRWPNAAYRAAFRRHFGAISDAELGFYSTRSNSSLGVDAPADPIDGPGIDDATVERDLVPLAGLAVFGSLMTRTPDILQGMRLGTTVPDRIGLEDVRYIEQTTDLFERWDFAFGGGLSRNAVLGHLEWTRHVHQRSSATPAVRVALQSAISRLAEVAGWMSFDAGDSPTARRCWLLGLHMASEAQDWPNRTNILMDMAREATYSGRPSDALNLMGMARTFQNKLTAAVRTAIHVVTARAYGSLGQETECLYQVGEAEQRFADRDTAEDPSWISYYDDAQLAGDCGHAVFGLAVQGVRIPTATALLTKATRLHGPETARAQALSRTKLAILHMLHGDPAEAAQEAVPVLRAVPGIRSARLVEDLRTLHRASAGQVADPAASNLRRDVRKVLRSVA